MSKHTPPFVAARWQRKSVGAVCYRLPDNAPCVNVAAAVHGAFERLAEANSNAADSRGALGALSLHEPSAAAESRVEEHEIFCRNKFGRRLKCGDHSVEERIHFGARDVPTRRSIKQRHVVVCVCVAIQEFHDLVVHLTTAEQCSMGSHRIGFQIESNHLELRQERQLKRCKLTVATMHIVTLVENPRSSSQGSTLYRYNKQRTLRRILTYDVWLRMHS